MVKTKKTILFYINAINGGGAERVIIEVAHHFANKGYRSVLVTSFIDYEYEYTIPSDVIRLSIEDKEVLQSRLKRNIKRILALHNIIKKEKPVAVISFMAEPNFRVLIASIGIKTKRIISVRNDPNREYSGIIGKFVGKHILPYADGCVFQTQEAMAWFPKRLQNKSAVIFNDVNKKFFTIKRENAHDIVTVGRLSSQKNQALLIDAVSKIKDKYPNERLLIYGSGMLEEKLEKQIDELGLRERVLLMGVTDNIPAVLSSAKIFVLSSDYEGMPNCLMEALAAGVPCISTDCPCGGPRELIKNNENGLLVPVKDSDAIAYELDRLLSDEEYANELGENAKERAIMFHPDYIFPQWLSFVEKVINRSDRHK